MRRNPLLYSDHSEIDEAVAYEAPKQKRSWLFYFIILANSLLVIFVLGIIWFLFLKSPDLHIKELSDRFFGTTTVQSLAGTKVNSTPQTEQASNTGTVAPNLSRQEQEDIQQIRLKQMRAQEEIVTERQRLEKIRIALEEKQIKTKQAFEQKATAIKATEISKSEPKKSASSTESVAASIKVDVQTKSAESITQQKEPDTNEEPAVVPNAASETLTPRTSTTGTQTNDIMETMKQREKEKATKQPLNDSRAPTKIKRNTSIAASSKPIINHRLIEKQLEALIETETLKSEAGKLLQHVKDLDKKIHINRKLSILQANAV